MNCYVFLEQKDVVECNVIEVEQCGDLVLVCLAKLELHQPELPSLYSYRLGLAIATFEKQYPRLYAEGWCTIWHSCIFHILVADLLTHLSSMWWQACLQFFQLLPDCSLSVSESWTTCLCGEGASTSCRSPIIIQVRGLEAVRNIRGLQVPTFGVQLVLSSSHQSSLSSTYLFFQITGLANIERGTGYGSSSLIQTV